MVYQISVSLIPSGQREAGILATVSVRCRAAAQLYGAQEDRGGDGSHDTLCADEDTSTRLNPQSACAP